MNGTNQYTPYRRESRREYRNEDNADTPDEYTTRHVYNDQNDQTSRRRASESPVSPQHYRLDMKI